MVVLWRPVYRVNLTFGFYDYNSYLDKIIATEGEIFTQIVS
jgi:hypothetical protein